MTKKINTEEFREYVLNEMKNLYDVKIEMVDFSEAWKDLDIDDQMMIGTTFGELKALKELSYYKR